MNLFSIIVVPAAMQSAGNQLAIEVGIDNEGKGDTLSLACVPKSGSASATPTYYACTGQLPDNIRAALDEEMPNFTGAFWWRTDISGIVKETWDGNNIGEQLTYDAALALVGLKRQVLPMPGNVSLKRKKKKT